ncbi:hypothetical protein ABZ468_51275 [Streptomyces sp. NPDC005708]|uniref:hypothetical protein n=1 Tax=Streptomyces sp. NPDC005708 TaxID=3154564 RepID=UPI0033E11CD7
MPERRREIGPRCAPGGGRGDIRCRFPTDAVLLSLLGGVAGTADGLVARIGYATLHNCPPAAPVPEPALGRPGAVVIGAPAICTSQCGVSVPYRGSVRPSRATLFRDLR